MVDFVKQNQWCCLHAMMLSKASFNIEDSNSSETITKTFKLTEHKLEEMREIMFRSSYSLVGIDRISPRDLRGLETFFLK